MYKVCEIISFVIVFFMIIAMIYNMLIGIDNHDSYRLILGMIDYIFIRDWYLDKTNNA